MSTPLAEKKPTEKLLSGKKLGVIHAALLTAPIVQRYADELLPGVIIAHLADDTIQMANNAAPVGCIPPINFLKFADYARNLQEYGVDAILLACSTFNQAAEHARPMIRTPMIQIDRHMMDLAVRTGPRIALLATLPTTVPSSRRLLDRAAQEAGKTIQVTEVLCSEAFRVLQAGDRDRHNALLMAEIDRLSNQVDAIVLAQISMTALEPLLTNTRVPVFNSGRTGLTKIRDLFLAQESA
jgi:Asp/Glu/hydantoin racemase